MSTEKNSLESLVSDDHFAAYVAACAKGDALLAALIATANGVPEPAVMHAYDAVQRARMRMGASIALTIAEPLLPVFASGAGGELGLATAVQSSKLNEEQRGTFRALIARIRELRSPGKRGHRAHR